MVTILKCTCEHEFQDKRYGKGMRVHNEKASKGYWVCTVCRREQMANSPTPLERNI